MRNVVILFIHLIVTVVRLARLGGLRSVVAESLLVKHQLRILHRGRKRPRSTIFCKIANVSGSPPASLSPFRYSNFSVTARSRRVHSSDDTLDMQAQHWPLRITQHDERDCANRQILLVADILVGVTSTSNPAASAAFSKSPFSSVSHPLSAVVWIVCCLRKGRMGTGVPWSKEDQHRGQAQTKESRRDCGQQIG
jgi:hypothetical protein